ncbi:MAG: helix-turn-helix transcriptional regulator [Candidatus Omnitrophica bacterium]|nr:helix-turn-helix transcriptional regulator [Candidatus Omnitrophota bacterium]
MFSHEILKKVREEKGLSLDGLATELGKTGFRVSRQTVWNWESGRHVPDANAIVALSEFFRKPLEYFFKQKQ